MCSLRKQEPTRCGGWITAIDNKGSMYKKTKNWKERTRGRKERKEKEILACLCGSKRTIRYNLVHVCNSGCKTSPPIDRTAAVTSSTHPQKEKGKTTLSLNMRLNHCGQPWHGQIFFRFFRAREKFKIHLMVRGALSKTEPIVLFNRFVNK